MPTYNVIVCILGLDWDIIQGRHLPPINYILIMVNIFHIRLLYGPYQNHSIPNFLHDLYFYKLCSQAVYVDSSRVTLYVPRQHRSRQHQPCMKMVIKAIMLSCVYVVGPWWDQIVIHIQRWTHTRGQMERNMYTKDRHNQSNHTV